VIFEKNENYTVKQRPLDLRKGKDKGKVDLELEIKIKASIFREIGTRID